MDVIDLARAADRARPLDELPSGEELRRLRNEARISRTVFAAAARVDVLTLTKYETGVVKQPRPAQALAYRRVLAALRKVA